MTQDTQTAKAGHVEEFQRKKQSMHDDDEDVEEVQPAGPRSLYDQVYEMAEKFASTRIGQFVIERGDRTLRIVEDTAKWSLPQGKSPESESLKLERPLPWLPFIMLIIMLRLARMWITLAALMIGNGPVTAHVMVYFIQTRRRKLRAIRVHGLKEIRRREMEENALKSGDMNTSLISKMKNLVSIAICRPGQLREPARRVFIYRGKAAKADTTQAANNAHDQQQPASKRPRDDDQADLNLTCDQLLAKYANENSEDDSDFIPNAEEADSANDTSTSSTSTDEGEIDVERETTESHKSHDKHDQSVEIKENGGRQRAMPKPLIEVKTEPTSDNENGNNEQLKTSKENGSTNRSGTGSGGGGGGGGAGADVVLKKNANLLNVSNGKESLNKSTPGHESAALSKPKIMPMFSSTATAGSPPDFNACFQPVSILKNSTQHSTEMNDQSTPKSAEGSSTKVETPDSTGTHKKHVQHQPSQKQQPNPNSSRYRSNKNRR